MTARTGIPTRVAFADVADDIRLGIEAAATVLAAVVIGVTVIAMRAVDPILLGMADLALVDRYDGLNLLGRVSHGP